MLFSGRKRKKIFKVKCENMYNILIFGMTETHGGVETFIMNYFRKNNSKKLHFDFLVNTYNDIAFQKEIIKSGSKIFRICPRRKNPLKFRRELNDFFKKNASNYSCIWVNANDLVNIDYLKLAKKYGINKRIIHAHNAGLMDKGLLGKIKIRLHKYHKKQISLFATDYWACSSLASNFFFPRKLTKKVKIITDAINVTNMTFDIEKRDYIRSKYKLESNFVIGNVGRLHFQKNQSFSLSVINNLKDKIPNVKLILVGTGPEEKNLERNIKDQHLEKYVMLAGKQEDIQAWNSSFDVFLFPSLFEGLGIAVLEAQANGLPVYASNNIPQEAKINSNVYFLPLEKGPKEWANIISCNYPYKRLNTELVKSNFNKTNFNLKNNHEIQTLNKDLLDIVEDKNE